MSSHDLGCFSCQHKNVPTTSSVVSGHSVAMARQLDDVINTEGQRCIAFIEIVNDPINIPQLLEHQASSEACGAISTFIGVTRNNFNGRGVSRLEYEAYSTMALKEMEKIVVAVFATFGQVHRVVISHRIGVVPVKEASVFIAVTTEHRKSGLDATAFAINTLKATVPIWKKEFYSGEHEDAAAEKAADSEWKRNVEFASNPSSPVKQ